LKLQWFLSPHQEKKTFAAFSMSLTKRKSWFIKNDGAISTPEFIQDKTEFESLKKEGIVAYFKVSLYFSGGPDENHEISLRRT
jgi:hypothetical protein